MLLLLLEIPRDVERGAMGEWADARRCLGGTPVRLLLVVYRLLIGLRGKPMVFLGWCHQRQRLASCRALLNDTDLTISLEDEKHQESVVEKFERKGP